MVPLSDSELINRLLQSPRGIVVICNLIDSISLGLFDQDTLRQFMSWWCSTIALLEGNPKDPIPGEKTFEALDILIIDPDAWESFGDAYPELKKLGRKPDFRVLCRRRPTNQGDDTALMTVLDTEAFFPFFAAETKDELIGTLSIDMTTEGNRLHATLESGRKSAALHKLKPDAQLGKPGEVFWYTLASGLQEKIAAGDADRVRDCLGLIHHNGSTDLIALKYTVKTKATPARPTALDAGSHQRFSAMPDKTRAAPNSAWGIAVDLAHFARREHKIAGAPERVALPLKQPNFDLLEIVPLGRTGITRGTRSSDNDQRFATRLARRRSKTALRKELMSHL